MIAPQKKFKGEDDVDILSTIRQEIERFSSVRTIYLIEYDNTTDGVVLSSSGGDGRSRSIDTPSHFIISVRLGAEHAYKFAGNTKHEKKNKEEIRKFISRIAKRAFGEECIVFLTAEEEVSFFISKMKEYVASHGGTLDVVKIDEEKGEIVVSMQGACAMCPSAVVTMKAGIRRFLSQYLPWLKRVEPAEEPKEPDFGFKLAPPLTSQKHS